MNNTFVVRPFVGAVVRVTAAVSLLIGLVAVAPALIPAQAHAAETPAPTTHTIDYILVSTSPSVVFLSTADLQVRTDKVSRAWSRMTRGVVEFRMGRVYTVPNFSSGPDFCNLTSSDPNGVLQATVGHPLDVYKDPGSGRHLAVVATDPDTSTCWFGGLSLFGNKSPSSGGMILLNSSRTDPDSDAAVIAHELGHNLGLYHAAVSTESCVQRFWDGPFLGSTSGMSENGCPINDMNSEYGDLINVMSNETNKGFIDRMTLNGAQMYQLGLIQPGAGVKEVTAGADEQMVTIQNRRTATPGLPLTVRMTADDPDGSGPCRPAIYHIDYDPVLGGVQVVRVARNADCGSRDPYSIDTISWSVTTSFDSRRTFFLPGESRLTQAGKVQVRVVSVDEGAGTATIGIRRTDVAGFDTVQLTSRLLEPGNIAHVPAGGGQLTAIVTTNQSTWSATANQPWAKVTASGTSGQEIAVAMGANPGAEERTVVVTVQAGAAVSTISVVQQPGPSQDDCAATKAWTCGWQDIGSLVRGALETPDDKDWFLITPATTGTWAFTVSGLADPVVTPLSPGLSKKPSTVQVLGDNQVQLSVDLEAGMPCYLQITGNGVSTGGYTITAVPAAPSITVSWDTFDLAGDGGAATFWVTSNTSWQVGPLADWLRPEVPGGFRPTLESIYAQPNLTGETRTWSVELTGQGQTATVSISQAPGSVSATECGVTPATACTQDDMSSPRHATIDYPGDKDWFAFTPDVTGTWSISATSPASKAALLASDGTTELAWDQGSAGQGGFRITAALVAGQTYYLEISASSTNHGPYTFSVTPPSNTTISVSPRQWDVTEAGGTRQVQVTSNSGWRVIVPDWITASPSYGNGNTTVTLTAKPNTTGQERFYAVSFDATGQLATIYVIQATPTVETGPQVIPTISLSGAGWDAPATGGTNAVKVTSNSDWQVIVPYWMTASPSYGNGNGTVTLVIEPNTTGERRSMAATFRVAGQDASFIICQPPQPPTVVVTPPVDPVVTPVTPVTPDTPTISVSSASWRTTAFGGVNVIQVKSNANWQVSVPEWVTASPASGSGDATVTLTVKPNTTGELRNSAAVFSVSGKQVSIPIVQPSFW